MKKALILIAVFIGINVFSAQAQINVGATVGVQMPIGTMADVLKTGFGFDLLGKYMLNENVAVGLNVGWSRFGIDMSGYDIPSGYEVSGSGSYVPITALAEYHFGTGKVKPFAGVDLGLYIAKAKVTVEGISVSESKANFGFAPVVGMEYEIQDNLAFTANLKYNYVMGEGDDDNFIGINAGIIYRIKK